MIQVRGEASVSSGVLAGTSVSLSSEFYLNLTNTRPGLQELGVWGSSVCCIAYAWRLQRVVLVAKEIEVGPF